MAAKVMSEEFTPNVEWTDDSSNRILRMHLPGFKRAELRAQLDTAGKILIIKGTRQVPAIKFIEVNQSFNVPKDIILEKIFGRFEDGCLMLIMPKKAVVEQVTAREDAIAEKKEPEKKDEPAVQDERSRKETKKHVWEKMEQGEEKKKPKKKDEPMHEEKTTGLAEKPKSGDSNKDEAIVQEKIKTEVEKIKKGEWKKEETKKDESMREDKPIATEKKKSSSQDTKVEAVENEKPKPKEEKKDESFENEKLKTVERNFEESYEKTIRRMKTKITEICIDKQKEITKKMSVWRGGEDSWLDSESLNGFLETVNKNRKVIAVAVVAFSAAVYASQKLRSSGK